MHSLLRVLHVLAVSLWFGSVAFFTVAGLLIFQAFSDVSALPADERPLWLPLPQALTQASPGEGFPEPLRLEQGSRAAGVAVGRIFPFYYALQAACGVIAVLTASALARSGEGSGHGWRGLLSKLALLTVLAGWWLERRVTELRVPRNDLTDRVLLAQSPSPGLLEEARAARAEFGRWHGYSLLQNFLTLACVAGLTICAASLSASPSRQR
jgi:hypothetical protein